MGEFNPQPSSFGEQLELMLSLELDQSPVCVCVSVRQLLSKSDQSQVSLCPLLPLMKGDIHGWMDGRMGEEVELKGGCAKRDE